MNLADLMASADSTDLTEHTLLVWRAPEGVRLVQPRLAGPLDVLSGVPEGTLLVGRTRVDDQADRIVGRLLVSLSDAIDAAAASLPAPRNEAERFLRRLLDRAGWHRADVGENCPACGQVAPCDNQKLAGDLAAALIVDACVLAMAGQ